MLLRDDQAGSRSGEELSAIINISAVGRVAGGLRFPGGPRGSPEVPFGPPGGPPGALFGAFWASGGTSRDNFG